MTRRVVIAIPVVLALVIAAGAFSAQTACAHDPRFACSPRDAPHPIVTLVERIGLSNPIRFYEPFSRVDYLSSGERDITLAPGRSTVVIAMRGGSKPQRYAFAIGRDERFGLLDLPYLVGALYRIHARKF